MPLVRHPDVASISFTGSNEAGREVTRGGAAASSVSTWSWAARTRSSSWTTPTSIWPSRASSGRAFGTTGQRCTAAAALIVQRRARRVGGATGRARETLRLGHGWDPQTEVGPLINRARDVSHSYMRWRATTGAKLLTGGEMATEGDLGKGSSTRRRSSPT